MIRLCKGCEPRILVENRERGTAEYETWLEAPTGREPRRYAAPDIRAALEAETHSKCAYCEGRFKPVSYGHIEHKLPKRKYPELVCAWTNLTVACQVCNTNKGDYDDPACRLLDPHVDDIEKLDVFAGSFALAACGRQVDKTIERLKLNRPDLLLAREEFLRTLNRILGLVERAVDESAVVNELWLSIDWLMTASGVFASACRQDLDYQLETRSTHPKPLGSHSYDTAGMPVPPKPTSVRLTQRISHKSHSHARF